MEKVQVIEGYCKSCKLCVIACPKKILEIGNKTNQMGYRFVVANKSDECIGCKMCTAVCPEGAIELYK